MITCEHCIIRTAEQDDAAALRRLYDTTRPRSALLDRRREMLVPSVDELREVLNHKEAKRGVFYAVEDRTGVIRGFCTVRGIHPEAAYAEFVVMFHNDADYDLSLADEACSFLTDRAFRLMRLNKVTAQCLDCEAAYRDFLVRHGFRTDGVQRDVFFTLGHWFNMESLSLLQAEHEAAATESSQSQP